MPDVYPINEYGPLMPGLIMAGVAITHVFLAQFAVGGGMLLCYFQWLAMNNRNPHARSFVAGYFKFLVLISFVVGALTGVGIWFTAIQISSSTIGAMVHYFHWMWAIEWTFFCVEIVAGYLFYRYHARINDRTALSLLVIYSAAAWMSLFIINGILSWQLTPGRWLETGRLAHGFFNPSFWPSLFFRTVVSMTLAALIACFVVNTMRGLRRADRRSLINRAAHFLTPMILMPILGIWFLAVMPEDSRRWALGGSPAMTLFLALAIAASAAIGIYALYGLVWKRMYINGVTAMMLILLAFAATAGGEFVREGSRKPFSIRSVLYSNAIRPNEISKLRSIGVLTHDPFPLKNDRRLPNEQLETGARVYLRLCSVCHTMDGANSLIELTSTWNDFQLRLNIARLQHTKPFMPPFAGSPSELEALTQYLKWSNRGRPNDWEISSDPAVLTQIKKWLDEAGTEPGGVRSHAASSNREFD